MNVLNAFLILCVFSSMSVTAAEIGANDELYEVDSTTKNLKISWPGSSVLIKGVVGDKGEVTRGIAGFDGKKALHYENLASRSQFEAYVTLKRVGDIFLVDCIYGNIRSEQNGALINKAVCGINEKVLADYEKLIYKYSEIWKKNIESVDTSPLMQDPPVVISIEDGFLNGLKILRVYESQDDFDVSSPRTVVQENKLTHDYGRSKVFTVYTKDKLDTPDHIEVVSKDLSEKFESFNYKDLKNLMR
ncbi:hypothetical protein [Pseudomonas syringae]|uniref:hypothetical protein n=1 Tax=Pseudomonas syringae TaxID=317 RepID=UPI000E313E96|nr:hypothetical protein [Pseudomonas syringae]